MKRLGVDIGGTFIKSAVIDEAGEIIASGHQPTPQQREPFLEALHELIARAVREHDVAAAGIGAAGFISRTERRIVVSPNLHLLDGMALEAELRRRAGIPVRVENDANAAAYGEYTALGNDAPGSFVHLTLGTGIGSGIVLNGELWTGFHGFAPELGHVPVNPEGRPCGCGGCGCSETESSEIGLLTSFRELCPQHPIQSARELHELWLGGHPQARAAFARAGRYFGLLLAIIAGTLDPAVISIGGGVAAAGEALLAPAREEFLRRVKAPGLRDVTIRPALLGNRAGMIGAALLSTRPIPEQP